MGKIKGWKKIKDKKDIVSYRTNATKDYNKGQPKHLQVKNPIFSRNAIKIIKGWSMKDVAERKMTNKNSVWVVDDMHNKIKRKNFKTKQEGIEYAINYMRENPNG